ncbi:hypothetical protein NLJ89_g3490 [Agrocybe chaxingu]|uniref:F-box domain-containing protein n=1 Tax=Agrocybe chaxingu TaxID=84603 RepID=A0A9W8K557_9AGAR|nr:hypothetical protein NLJ89_g3490 [Agrocybe chaxingu]
MLACLSCGTTDSLDLHDVPIKECRLSEGEKCKSCRAIEQIDVEIEVIKRSLALNLEKRRTLKSERNDRHDSLTQLPPELYSRIFIECLPQELYPFPRRERPPRQERLPVPMLLSSVSRRWRALAHFTPQLWSFIRVRLDYPDSLQSAKLMREWLTRSGDLLVSIDLYLKRRSPGDEYERLPDNSMLPLIDVVNDFSHRWGVLELNMPSALIPKICGDSSTTSTLDALHISPIEWPRRAKFSQVFVMKNALPSPTRISLCGLYLSSIAIDWTNVTHTETVGLHLDECVHLLRAAPRLVHCDFQIVQPLMPIHELPHDVITCRSLQWLDYEDRHNAARFFNLISLPSLRCLSISPEQQTLEVLESVTACLKRSSCPLTSLKIAYVDLRDAPLIPLLEATPTLEILDLVFVHPSDALFQRLGATAIDAYNQEEDAFLPYLRVIKLWGPRSYSWTSICDLYQCGNADGSGSGTFRRECTLNISVSSISGFDDEATYIDKDVSALFQALIEDGVDLRIADSRGRSMIKLKEPDDSVEN